MIITKITMVIENNLITCITMFILEIFDNLKKFYL